MSFIKNGDSLVKYNGKLVKVQGESDWTRKVPGLYDEDNNLVKTWDELVAEGLVTVE